MKELRGVSLGTCWGLLLAPCLVDTSQPLLLHCKAAWKSGCRVKMRREKGGKWPVKNPRTVRKIEKFQRNFNLDKIKIANKMRPVKQIFLFLRTFCG